MVTRALDLFCGTGWGVALQQLEVPEVGVDTMPAVQQTRTANGMWTAYADVWEGLDGRREPLPHDLLIASPPCQTFSIGGRGAGRRALSEVLALIEDGTWLDPAALRAFGEQHDERTALVLTPLAYAMAYRPDTIVLEQVPPVLPVWQAIGRVLARNGYQVATAVLNAEQYGVPQTRRRAILVAAKGRPAVLPTPTHSRYYTHQPDKLDPNVLPWVSMAEALGWGMTRRPYLSLAPGTAAGGTDPAGLGGSGARRILTGERTAGRWDEAPAPVVNGDPRIAPRGCKHPMAGCCSLNPDGKLNGRQFPEGTIRLTAEQAARLQSYPEGFRWVGGKGQVFQQIGNAVPPLMARRVLEAALGVAGAA